MQYSKNLGLNLPERNDQFNIDHFNENTVKTDEQLKINNDDINTVNERLLEEIKDRESANDTLQSNIDAKLNKNQSTSDKGKVMEVSDNGELKPSGLYRRTYTTLEDLGLTPPVSVGEIFNAMPDKTMAVIACEGREGNTEGAVVHVSDVPISYGVLTIRKNEKGRFSIEYQNSLGGSPCDVKRWIGTLKGTDGSGLYWKQLSAEPTFVTLKDIGLTANATLQDVIDTLPKGGSALLGVKDFTNYQTIFPYEEGNDQFARVYIVKGWEDGSCMYARWFRKDGSKEAIAIFNKNDNNFNGWKVTSGNLNIITEDTITKYGTEILKYPIGTWRINNVNIGKQFTDLPHTITAGIIEIDSIQPNSSPYEHAYGYRNYTIRDALTANIYVRILNSGDTEGALHRDTGWQKMISAKDLDTTVAQLDELNVLSRSLTTNSGVFYLQFQRLNTSVYGDITFKCVVKDTPVILRISLTSSSCTFSTINGSPIYLPKIAYNINGKNIILRISFIDYSSNPLSSVTVYGTQVVEFPISYVGKQLNYVSKGNILDTTLPDTLLNSTTFKEAEDKTATYSVIWRTKDLNKNTSENQRILFLNPNYTYKLQYLESHTYGGSGLSYDEDELNLKFAPEGSNTCFWKIDSKSLNYFSTSINEYKSMKLKYGSILSLWEMTPTSQPSLIIVNSKHGSTDNDYRCDVKFKIECCPDYL